METPSQWKTLQAGPRAMPACLVLSIAARGGEQDQQRDGRCLFKIILASIDVTNDHLFLGLLGSTSLRWRACCQLLRQIAPMEGVAALETPQEKAVNLWLSLRGLFICSEQYLMWQVWASLLFRRSWELLTGSLLFLWNIMFLICYEHLREQLPLLIFNCSILCNSRNEIWKWKVTFLCCFCKSSMLCRQKHHSFLQMNSSESHKKGFIVSDGVSF